MMGVVKLGGIRVIWTIFNLKQKVLKSTMIIGITTPP